MVSQNRRPFPLKLVNVRFGSSGGGTPSCKPGYVYDTNKQTCVKASSGLFDDEQLYQQGRALALGGSVY